MPPPFPAQLEALDTETDAMTALVAEWSEISSGSGNAAGLNRMRARLTVDFGELPAAVVEEVPLKVSAGEFARVALRLRCRPQATRQVLLAGHYDTVFGPEHPFQSVIRPGADPLLRGPGVADMKGGLAVMLHALKAFETLPDHERLGWEVLLVPDEELGSPWSRELMAEAARSYELGLVFEPALPDGGLASARKGSGNFTATVCGRAAHAGRDFAAGRNAVAALAEFIVGVDGLNGRREGLTVNVGSMTGGGPANIVPNRASCVFNVRTVRPDDEAWVSEHLAALAQRTNARDGFHLDLAGEFSSPPKPAHPGVDAMLRGLATCAEELGLPPLTWSPTGGTCDGNRLLAAGLPNVDNLGPRGGGLHSAEEFIDPRSLPERAKLTALFLWKLATGAWTPPAK